MIANDSLNSSANSSTLHTQVIEPSTVEASSAPLMIVHGLFGSGDNWLSIGRKLAVNRRVLLVDLPNHGKSPWTKAVSYQSLGETLAEEIIRQAQEAGGIPLALLGHSMGGKAAMAAALQLFSSQSSGDARALDKLLVADIAPVPYEASHIPYFDAMQSVPLGQITTRSEADSVLAKTIDDKLLRAFFLKNLLRTDDGSFSWKINLPVLRRDYPSILGWEESGVAQLPTLFIRGDKSPYIDREAHLPLIRNHFPHAHIETVKDAGHWLHAEQPGRVLEIVEKFLQ